VKLAADILTGVVAVAHVWFMILEMVLWTTPYGLKTFRQTKEAAMASKSLAMNQGLYNGFLAAGLAWGLYAGLPDVKLFFLGCVLVAGLFGGATASRAIFFVQALPAAIALALQLASR
jgi:putative membrane protein